MLGKLNHRSRREQELKQVPGNSSITHERQVCTKG